MMTEKRPHPDGDSVDGANKRPRADNVPAAPPKTDIQKKIAEAKARAEAVKARLAAQKGGAPSPAAPASPSPAASSPAPAPSAADAVRARVEAMRARVAAATARTNESARQPPPAQSFQPPPTMEVEDNMSRGRGGLGVGLHPSLMQDGGQDARSKGKQAVAPKFATTMANRRTESPANRDVKKQLDLSGPSQEELKKNPYYDQNLGGSGAKSRQSKQLVFNQKGKFIAQANALRRQAALEAMKKRIADQARKVGLDEENERVFLVPEPPAVEWWDEGLLEGKDYDNLDTPGKVKIDSEDSIITIYVQHPVLIEPPQEKNAPAPKPMYLTKKEQAKVRRQRRNAEHKEQQDKIRLGLEPPPPPKIKKSNMMRVLGEQAVKDPTAVEARVNREIAERAQTHEQNNEERKLTKEQRHEKIAKNQAVDASKGIFASVYKISNLAYGKHRYQIDVNAKQHGLTGICIMNPKFCMVIVEGGEHSIEKYKKLMLHRIRWTENAAPSSVREGNREAEKEWLQSVDDKGELKDFSFNKCELIWEGQERHPSFKKWVGMKSCETDIDAKDVLTRAKMENMWTLAKTKE